MDTCKFSSIYAPMSEIRSVIPISDLDTAARILDIDLDESILDAIARGENFIRSQDSAEAEAKAEQRKNNPNG